MSFFCDSVITRDSWLDIEEPKKFMQWTCFMWFCDWYFLRIKNCICDWRDWRDHVIPTRSGFIFGSVISVIAVIMWLKKIGFFLHRDWRDWHDYVIPELSGFFCSVISVIGVIMWFKNLHDFFLTTWLARLSDSRIFKIFLSLKIGVIDVIMWLQQDLVLYLALWLVWLCDSKILWFFFAPWLTWLAWLCDSRTFRIFLLCD